MSESQRVQPWVRSLVVEQGEARSGTGAVRAADRELVGDKARASPYSPSEMGVTDREFERRGFIKEPDPLSVATP